MQDVTMQMNRYRECARGLWNNFLRDSTYVDVSSCFSRLRGELLHALVLAPLGRSGFDVVGTAARNEPLSFLHVEPRVDGVPVMVSRGVNEGGYWDDPLREIGPQRAEMLFIDYFDWDSSGYVDLTYVRVKITRFAEHVHLVGREALIEAQYVRVMCE